MRSSSRGSITHAVPPPKPIVGIMLNDEYVLGSMLGKGAFGMVYECQQVRTGQVFAVKRINLRNLKPDEKRNLLREAKFLEMLDHPNIVQFVCTIKQSDHFNIVLQLMENGSLAQNLNKYGAISPALTALYIRQVLSALEYLQDQEIIHRDIKGANLLTDKFGRVKLSDFGIAISLKTEDMNMIADRDSFVGVGSPNWMAPEVLPSGDQDIPIPTVAYDIWSLGCTVIELLTQNPPWADLNPNAVITKMATQPIPISSSFPNEVKDFLQKCFVRSPGERATATMLLEHPWMLSSKQLSKANSNTIEDAEGDVLHAPLLLRNKTAVNSSFRNLSISSNGAPQHSLPGQIYESSTNNNTSGVIDDLLFSNNNRQSSMRTSRSNSLFPLGENVKVNAPYPNTTTLSTAAGVRNGRMGSLNNLFTSDNFLFRETSSLGQEQGTKNRFAIYKETTEDLYFADMSLEMNSLKKLTEMLEDDTVQNSQQLVLFNKDKFPPRPSSTNTVDGKLKSAKVHDLLVQLIKRESVESNCDALIRYFQQDAELKQLLFVQPGGLSPLIELLRICSAEQQPLPTKALLKLFCEAVANDRAFQELFCLVGIVPLLTQLVGKDKDLDIRKQAALFVSHFLQTTPLILHLFVACGGIHTIVALLESPGDAPPVVELAICAVDGVQRIFAETAAPVGSHRRQSVNRALSVTTNKVDPSRLDGVIPKNDFCLLFSKTPLMERLAALGQRLQTEEGRRECPRNLISPLGFLSEICHLFFVFSTSSVPTKVYLAQNMKCLRFMLQTSTSRWAAAAGSSTLEMVPDDEVEVDMDTVRALLNALRNLCYERDCLEFLDGAGVIQSLVPFLSVRKLPKDLDSSMSRRILKRRSLTSIEAAIPEVHDCAMVALFYLCFEHQQRQERAAVCGMIPYLIEAIRDRTFVKAFSLQLLMEMSEGTLLTRNCLYRDKALDLFLDLLGQDGDQVWQERALFALSQFLNGQNPEFERALLRPVALQKMMELFQNAQAPYFELITNLLLLMMEKSPMLSEALGRCGFMLMSCSLRVQSEPSMEGKMAILKLVNRLCEAHEDCPNVLLEHNFPFIVMKLKAEAGKKQVALSTYCSQLLLSWNKSLDVQL